MTDEERIFFEAFGCDLLKLEEQLKSLVAATSQNPNISREDLMAAVKSQSEGPGYDFLDEDGKKKYVKTMTREVDQMFKKSKRDLTPDEVISYLTRFLLNFIEKNNEFDFFAADRGSSTFFQVEVKSFPQTRCTARHQR